MKYFLSLLVFGILCHNALARGLDNPILNDFERRLVRLETRQFSESENLEHRMLQLETQLGTKKGEETLDRNQLERNFYQIAEEKKPAEGMTFLQRLEKVERNWEKQLEEQLARFSSKYEDLSERFSAIEKHVEAQKISVVDQIMEKLSTLPEGRDSDSDESKNTISKEYKSQKIGSKYYYIENNEKLTWSGAVLQCNEMNAHLVSLQNEEEWSNLTEALDSEHSYWTDINDRAKEDVFESKSFSRRAPFLKWDENEPNSLPGLEDCVELRSDHGFRMNDVDCDELKYFICESNNPDD